MSDITKEFASNLDGEAVWISSFDDGTAAELADDFIDRVIATLRRDPRWSSLEPSELALFFADLRRRLAQDLNAAFGGCAPYWDIRECAIRAMVETLADRAASK